MNTTWRGALVLLIALASIGSVCEDDENEITGTYSVSVFEIEDACDNEHNSFSLELDVQRQGEGFTVEVNGAGPLTGDLRDDGILAVAGTITETDGTRPRQVQLEMDIRRGRIVDGAGRITWNGTFPGVPGVCVQRLGFTGSRLEVTPLLG